MLNPDYRDMLSAFGEKRVEYLVVGAYALAAHGAPRATGDLELPILGRSQLIQNKRALGRQQDLADIERLESAD